MALNPDRLLMSSEVNSTVDWSVSSHTVPGERNPENLAVNHINTFVNVSQMTELIHRIRTEPDPAVQTFG